MNILTRESRLGQLVDALEYQQILKAMARSAVDSALSATPIPTKSRKRAGGIEALGSQTLHQAQRLAGPLKKAGKPALAATAAIAGVTAVSAAVSSGRKRDGSGS